MTRIRSIGVLAILALAIMATFLAFPAPQPSVTAARSDAEQVQRREPWYLDFGRTQQVQRREQWYLDFQGGQEIPRREQWYLDFPGK